MKRTILLFLFLSFLKLHCYAQQLFQHAEQITGFTDMKENNGVAVADYDGDFDLDILVVSIWKDELNNPETQTKLFRNNGNGTYSDVTLGSGLENLLPFNDLGPSYNNFLALDGFKFGAYWGDYDNDGDPDLLFTHRTKVQLYQNKGDGTFVNVTSIVGIEENNGCDNMGAMWFDYNNDGNLDLYIVDWKGCNTNTLYRNNGNGTFQNNTLYTGLSSIEKFAGYNPFPFDFNGDGWMDIYVTNDLREPNQLLINNNGTSFTEAAAEYHLDVRFNDMGITIGDYNKDQRFDFFITTIANNVLLTGRDDGSYNDNAEALGLKETDWSWGTRFGDFDLDGDEDLIVVNGFKNANPDAYTNYYFENLIDQGEVAFSNVNDQGIADVSVSVEVIDFDYDLDGDLDLLITNTDQPSFFYENTVKNTLGEGDFNWFQLSLQGTLSNRDGIGTKITIITDSDKHVRYYSGIGFLGQSLKPVHFGLGNATRIEELKIEWPSGIIDTYQEVEINSFGKAIEQTSYENLNISPAAKIYGCTDPNSCNYNPEATVNDGSCSYVKVSQEILGPTQVGFLSTESYSFTLEEGQSIHWSVEGGNILSGQSTSTVSIQWEYNKTGKIIAIIDSGICKSQPISLDINFNLDQTSDEKSIARIWNEVLLEAIRNDYARPTVHARNLFHTSIAMYDAWALYSEKATPYLIGNNIEGFTSTITEFQPEESVAISRIKALSYAVYRLLSYRFKESPGAQSSQENFDFIMEQLSFDTDFTDVDYTQGDAAALGNFIAQTIIDFGLQDGSEEANQFQNQFYVPENPPLVPKLSGNPNMVNPNRWQSLSLDTYVDQSGNLIEGSTIDFLSPEWGNVIPFAMQSEERSSFVRDGSSYLVYHDPSDPPYLGTSDTQSAEYYKKGFAQVSIWGSHLDPSDGVLWDISPKVIGNISSQLFPKNYSSYDSFYNRYEGGDISLGHAVNPRTNEPYESQIVPRGDYTRVLAEFWADGPDSETPPGHWFTILNYVNDYPEFQRKLKGEGEELSPLEWDVKAYFLLGGAMHDAAIAAWSVKGWYDYIRPISAIRYMAGLGQSSDPSLPNYHENGIELEPGFVELVKEDDPLAEENPNNINKIKVYTWRGHDAIRNPVTDQAGVGWILAENWRPYQRPSFVTPPFAGYVSGHSTYSRAAAEVLTLLTGDSYFPGGKGEFLAKKNEFLIFEKGPSVDVTLQWATYRDASDQCSLSRIWGGIHPPADDIPGRLIGEKVGIAAFHFGVDYFDNQTLSSSANSLSNLQKLVYPNPIFDVSDVYVTNTDQNERFRLSSINGRNVEMTYRFEALFERTKISLPKLTTGVYILRNNQGNQWKLIVE